MKTFNIPVGKILAVGTGALAIGVSECLGRAIKRSEAKKHNPWNMFIQATSCSAIESAAMQYAIRLWKAEHLNLTINVLGTSDYNEHCTDDICEIINDFERGKYTDEDAVKVLSDVCRKYHRRLSFSTMIEIIRILNLSDNTAALLTSDNEELCQLLVTLNKPKDVHTPIYDGKENPADACMLLNSMYKLYTLANEIDDHGVAAKFVADHLYTPFKNVHAIRVACQSCELMVANTAPWLHEGGLVPWLSRVTKSRHCMDVALSLAALVVNTPENVDLKIAGIVYYSARMSNPEGFKYFTDSFPELADDLHRMVSPKHPGNSTALTVVIDDYETLTDENNDYVKLAINLAAAAADIIYAKDPGVDVYDEIVKAFANENRELISRYGGTDPVKILHDVADNQLEAISKNG